MLIAGLSGGSGKTLVALGIARAFSDNGLLVQTFKKGPDYVDAQWLSVASRSVTTNLDPFLFSSEVLKNVFWHRATGCDLALIEGNRGLYDGKDVFGTYSSAELAKFLQCPVLVVTDCTKVTRTMAAIILGLQVFDRDVDIRGIILNQTAGKRHQTILQRSIEQYTDVPVLGVLPRMDNNPIPERRMGLVSDFELDNDPLMGITFFVRQNIDLDSCLQVAQKAPVQEHVITPILKGSKVSQTVKIGVASDASLWFYYRENLEALSHAGAELIDFSLVQSMALPEDNDALYLGGGFPEIVASKLAANTALHQSIAQAINQGLPVYAESGGLVYLSTSLEEADETFPMVGIFPLTTKIFPKPQGHGYMESVVANPNPFFPLKTTLCGHEFHYSRSLDIEVIPSFVFQIKRGKGMTTGWDGILIKNCLASYIHTHALSLPQWAENFVAAAKLYQSYRKGGLPCPDIRL